MTAITAVRILESGALKVTPGHGVRRVRWDRREKRVAGAVPGRRVMRAFRGQRAFVATSVPPDPRDPWETGVPPAPEASRAVREPPVPGATRAL